MFDYRKVQDIFIFIHVLWWQPRYTAIVPWMFTQSNSLPWLSWYASGPTDDPSGILSNAGCWLEHHISSSFLLIHWIKSSSLAHFHIFSYVPSICFAFSLVKPKFPACCSCQVHQSHSWHLGRWDRAKPRLWRMEQKWSLNQPKIWVRSGFFGVICT